MAETTAEAPGTPAAAPVAPPEAPPESTPEAAAGGEMAREMVKREALGIRELVEAGCHFGHQTRRWNPRMKRFLFGERDGVHILDLDQTLPRFQDAIDFLRETTASGGKVLFVATKRQAQPVVEAEATRAGQYYVNRRWLGGMLTNFKTVKKSIDRYKELLELVGDEEKVAGLSKKELSRINRQIEKYSKSLDGMKEMTRLPDAMFVIDVNREAIGVVEASRLGIPIVAIVDSNCDPDLVDLIVPGNDDSLRAIQLYCERVADACLEGLEIHNSRIQAEVSAEEAAKGGEKAATTGRVVVEIQQPEPRKRRGRGEGRGDRQQEAPKPAGPRNPRGEGGRDGVLTAATAEAEAVAEAPEEAPAEEPAATTEAEAPAATEEAPAEAASEAADEKKTDGE